MKYEYGVACAIETYWPTWPNWMARFRLGRWVLARRLARGADEYSRACGPHRVVRRVVP